MNDTSKLFGVSMAGWICVLLALGLVLGMLLKIPLDTQYITICNSVLVAYVITPRRPVEGNGNGNGKSKPSTDQNPGEPAKDPAK